MKKPDDEKTRRQRFAYWAQDLVSEGKVSSIEEGYRKCVQALTERWTVGIRVLQLHNATLADQKHHRKQLKQFLKGKRTAEALKVYDLDPDKFAPRLRSSLNQDYSKRGGKGGSTERAIPKVMQRFIKWWISTNAPHTSEMVNLWLQEQGARTKPFVFEGIELRIDSNGCPLINGRKRSSRYWEPHIRKAGKKLGLE